MKIYKDELKAGLGDIIQNNSIAFCSELSTYLPNESELNLCKNIKAIADVSPNMDLFYIKSILASVGWNKNDDVFDPIETWKAKSSPEDKQFNFMHDEKDIIGHITSCYASDADGNILPDFNDMSQVPSVFDIVTGAVLYTSWSDKKLKDRMQNIIAEVNNGEVWHVSMECLFPAFDYAMIDSKGSQKIVKRAESSAFLTKHLRAYGGTGEYEGYKVGRLLRDFSFSGVGLVKKPANPRSVILNHKNNINFNESKAQEIIMQDELELLKAELAEAKKAKEDAENEAKKAKKDAEATVKQAEEDAKKSKEEAEMAKKSKADSEEDAKKAKEDAKKSKEEAEMAKKSKADSEEELEKMKKEKTMQKRKAQLAEAGIDASEIDSTSVKFESLADEIFDTVVAAIKKVKTSGIPVKDPAAPKYSPSGDDLYPRSKPNGDYKIGKAEEEVDANESDASVLDSAQASPNQIPMVDSAEEEDLRSFASEWFSSNVLKSTANIK
jgi:hypothetical protein